MFTNRHAGLFVDFECSHDALEIIRFDPGCGCGINFAQAFEQVADSVLVRKTG